eukprot:scaffold9413_cov70-Cylindrotheca_fusiformis.AAC.1
MMSFVITVSLGVDSFDPSVVLMSARDILWIDGCPRATCWSCSEMIDALRLIPWGETTLYTLQYTLRHGCCLLAVRATWWGRHDDALWLAYEWFWAPNTNNSWFAICIFPSYTKVCTNAGIRHAFCSYIVA